MRTDSPLYSIIYQDQEKEFLLFDKALFAYAYYKNYRINLLNGEREELGIKHFDCELEQLKISDDFEKPRVINLQYEYAQKLIQDEDVLLAIDISFNKSDHYKISKNNHLFHIQEAKKNDFNSYQSKFEKVYQHLVDGDSYQVNLTSQFYFTSNSTKVEDYINALWENEFNRGEYAHCIYSSHLSKLFLSNSPECLFEYKNKDKTIISKPIKGTVQVDNSKEEAWEKLRNSKKDQAELFMITDLMRNDLTKLELNPAKVKAIKECLFVPGLVHSYSLIESEVSDELNLKKIVECLFPGGSITGAPKLKTTELIGQIESEKRGFYCGSTLVLYKDIKKASINIRSATIDTDSGQFCYGSGGAITLLSNANDEYKESLSKLESFIQNFQS